jgi:uncharacterized protein (TIGR04255 family)
MATPRRLSNPPIKEALVDLRVEGAEAVDAAAFKQLHDDLRGRYPALEERNAVEAKLQLGKAGGIAAAVRQVGFVGVFLRSADQHRVAQFRRDGFTLNQVGQYTSADDLFLEVDDLWPRYLRVVMPKTILAVQIRYINELSLPLGRGDALDRFLLAPPRLPEGMPQFVNQFQVNLLLSDEPTQSRVQVMQSLASGKPDARYVLDIVVARQGPLPVDVSLREHLEQLRNVKNRLFFSMVTDEALQPYDNQHADSSN